MAFRKAHYDAGANNVQKQGPTDVLMSQRKPTPITTAGAGVVTVDAMLGGIVLRTGPAAGYVDTFPSALQLIMAIPELSDQDSFEFTYINGVAQAMTFAAGATTDVTVGTVNVAASLWRDYLVTLLAGGVGGSLPVTGVNGQNTLTVATLALLDPVVGVPITGNLSTVSANGARFRVGQAVTGTNIAAGAVVTAINYTTGVITLSASNTGAVNGAATFAPRVEYRGLRSGTA